MQTFYSAMQNEIKYSIREFWKNGRKPLLYLLIFSIAISIFIPIFTYLYFVSDITSKKNIITRKNTGVVLLDRNDKPFFTFYEAKSKKTITFDKVSVQAKHAVIAIEDKNFYKHPAFSFSGIARAVIVNIEGGKFISGGSTITQQLVKNTLLSPRKSLLRKYQELVIALELERRFSKDDILEMYLNTAYFGEGAFGIDDASHIYFGKSASELNLSESALLAAILNAPSKLSPISGDRKEALSRQKIVLKLMEEQGSISPDEKNAAEKEEIAFNPQKEQINVVAPHFALMVKDELIKQYGEQKVAQSGFVVKTTLDLALQQYAQDIVGYQVEKLKGNKASNGAVVILDPKTGEILSLVGSHDWFDETNGKINMATSPRQSGSAFKPVIYAKAFEDKLITPATVLSDSAATFPDGYKPKDFDGREHGNVLVRYALSNSLNIPAVHVMQMVGQKSGVQFAKRLGISSLSTSKQYGLSFVLGSSEIPLVELTTAYATFANSGTRITPTIISKIQDKKGNAIYTYEIEQEPVLDKGVVFLISSILSDNKSRFDTFGNALTISHAAAVKTGTTENFRDALTVGYTPSIVVGVWVGNNDATPMDNIAGSLGAAPIWRSIMEYYLKDKPQEQFFQPSNIQRLLVCRTNGLRAEHEATQTYFEYFLAETIPNQWCNLPSPTPTPPPYPTFRPLPSFPSFPRLILTPFPTPRSKPYPTLRQRLKNLFKQ